MGAKWRGWKLLGTLHLYGVHRAFTTLIEFIESTVFGLINQITQEQENGLAQAGLLLA